MADVTQPAVLSNSAGSTFKTNLKKKVFLYNHHWDWLQMNPLQACGGGSLHLNRV